MNQKGKLSALEQADLAFIKLVLIAHGSERARELSKKIEVDMGKGSARRPENKSKFDENFDRIFGKPEEKKKEKKPYRTEPDYPVNRGDDEDK